MSDLVCLRTYPNRSVAEFAQGFLESNNIRCAVTASDAGYDIAFATGGARLLVNREDVDNATQLLQTLPSEAQNGSDEDDVGQRVQNKAGASRKILILSGVALIAAYALVELFGRLHAIFAN